MVTSRTKWLSGILCALVISGAVGGAVYYYSQPQARIYEFQDERDFADVKKLVEDNWYWLIESKDYQIDFALKNRAPSHKDPKYFGKLKINVLRKDDEFIGFVAYYKKSFFEGTVLFLAIRQEMRGKRYAPELLNYALKQLKNEGAIYATLVTRPSNLSAQAVYTRAGFTETGRDETYVYYEKSLE